MSYGNQPAWQEVLGRVATLGLPHGREQSFKMVDGRLLADRLLVGIPRGALPRDVLRALATDFAMPVAAWELLDARLPQANAVFLATEEAGGDRMFKMYLEFWDEARRAVRAGSRDPQLLHLGAKWNSARPGQHEEARYMCHPLLSMRDILRRMADGYPAGGASPTLEVARSIVRRAAARAPEAAFLYLDVQEAGNPRRSFDVNLYKSGLLVREVADALLEAAAHLGVAPGAIAQQLEELGERPLGHISGGRDRHGSDFLSVYAEIAPLPEG